MNNFPVSFKKIVKAKFIERPNRFIVRCVVEKIGVIFAHLPNPGRLWEIFFPGTILYLSHDESLDKRSSSKRKTSYTVIAAQREGYPIFLHTHLTNQVARYLIENGHVPALAGAEIIGREVSCGNSRFDFLLRKDGKDFYLEVKSCTLFGNQVAMFPDAVTERGRKHLLELAEMGNDSIKPAVMFVVNYPHVRWFMPDYHTDYEFSKTFLDVRNRVQILPVAIEWKPDFTIGPKTRSLNVPWDFLKKEIKDSGSYIIILKVRTEKTIGIGALGNITFQEGYYLYAGSAMKHLTKRIERHRRKRKRTHWHIDYLTQQTDWVASLPIRSSIRLECEIAGALSLLLETGIPGFGSSDCKCPTHLFHSRKNPLHTETFHEMLQSFRMRKEAAAGLQH